MSSSWQISPEAAGKRLDSALALASGQTRSSLTKLFKAELITIDGQPASSKMVVSGGEKVVINPEASNGAIIAAPDLKVLFEDEDVLAVEKPAGLVVHLSESRRPQPTVAEFAAKYGVVDTDTDRAGIVHRLDKDTSGVLLLAKHPESKEYLQKLFKTRQVHKTYLALVRGRLDPSEASINLPIGRSRKQPTTRAVVPGARASVTHYRTIRSFDGFTLAEIELETGRTHQIRVHMSHLGHPVAGDSLYGGPSIPGLNRQFLHAAKVTYRSKGGKSVTIESKLPIDLVNVLNKLQES
jgi:23S rRNA pseudouridine1911/1915/1917 synthase